MNHMQSILVIGDIHGHYQQLLHLLWQHTLVNKQLTWTGGTTTLVFLGDFVDRGPDGIAVLDLVMRLQSEAALAGGQVAALLGNHDLLLLAVRRFGMYRTVGMSADFRENWQRNGGCETDLAALTPRHLTWLMRLPALLQLDNRLFMHADSMFYTHYGRTITQVNRSLQALMQSNDTAAYVQLLNDFCDHGAFYHRDGARRAADVLRIFGGQQIIHGHMPICYMLDQPPATVTCPLYYNKNVCVNMDGGIGLDAPGFIGCLPAIRARPE